MNAALSADNLAASIMPATLRRLYIAVDPDPAGLRAANALFERSRSAGVHAVRLMPTGEDFNADLMEEGADALRGRLAAQLLAEDLECLNEDHHRAAIIDRA
jgi:DNA primase